MNLSATTSEHPVKTSRLRKIAALGIVIVCFSLVVGIFVAFLSDKDATGRDFIEYWAAGQQLVHGANPYDPIAMLRLQRAVGLEGNEPRVTLSPPVVLFLTLPLGFVEPKTGLILWLIVLNGCLSASIWMLWILHGRPDNGLQFCSYFFAPAVACLMAGQLGIYLLLGIVLFLFFHESRPYIAGAALLPCVFKPHLFLPFLAVLLLWVMDRKTYRILIGFAAATLASCAFPLWFDHHVWSEYSQLMSEVEVVHAFVPTLSVAFRFLVDRNLVWLQFLPESAACVWALWYFWSRREQWQWLNQGLLVLLVSAMCAPYAWFSDEALLLAPVLSGVFLASESGRSLLPIGLIAGAALIEISVVGHMASAYYLWTMPAWLGWYLYATWNVDKQAIGIRRNAEVVVP